MDDLKEGGDRYKNVRTVLLDLAGSLRAFEANLESALAMHRNQLQTLQAQADPCSGWGFMDFLCRPVMTLLDSSENTYELALVKLETGSAKASESASGLAKKVLEKCKYAFNMLTLSVLISFMNG